MKTRTIIVGGDRNGEVVTGGAMTEWQIAELRRMPCLLADPDDPTVGLTWDDLDNPRDPRTLLQVVLGDRRVRVDRGKAMADRPPVAVVTIWDGCAVRLEFYQGHDALTKTHDLRAAELYRVELPDWMTRDPQAYNPAAFLAGLGLDWLWPAIRAAHHRGENRGPDHDGD